MPPFNVDMTMAYQTPNENAEPARLETPLSSLHGRRNTSL